MKIIFVTIAILSSLGGMVHAKPVKETTSDLALDVKQFLKSNDAIVRRQAAVLIFEISSKSDRAVKDPMIPDKYLTMLNHLSSDDVAFLMRQREWEWTNSQNSERNKYHEALRIISLIQNAKFADLAPFSQGFKSEHTEIVFIAAAANALKFGPTEKKRLSDALRNASESQRTGIEAGMQFADRKVIDLP